MEERELRSRVSWIVGLVLATVFVGTIVWSVAQDADDDAADGDDEVPTTVTFDEVGEPIDPGFIPPLPRPEPLDPPEATLTVHTDGCGVIRSEPSPPVDDLTWVVKDTDGFQVLGRNALGEDRYRYYRPGTYTVVLESAGVEISDTVTITC